MWRKCEQATVLMRQSYTRLCLIRSPFLSQQHMSHRKTLQFIHDSWFLTQSGFWKSMQLLIHYHYLMSICICKCWFTFSWGKVVIHNLWTTFSTWKSVLRVRDGTTCFIFDFQNWLHFVDDFLLFHLFSFSHNNHFQLWLPELFASMLKFDSCIDFLSTRQWTGKM